jgi:hypothetical protein
MMAKAVLAFGGGGGGSITREINGEGVPASSRPGPARGGGGHGRPLGGLSGLPGGGASAGLRMAVAVAVVAVTGAVARGSTVFSSHRVRMWAKGRRKSPGTTLM